MKSKSEKYRSYIPSNWEADLAHEPGYERAPYEWVKKEKVTNE